MIQKFFILEGGYLAIALFVLAITLFVSTRPFMPKGAYKKGLTIVTLVLTLFIGGHYTITINRMAEVSQAFIQDKPILCESRMLRKAAQSITIQKSKDWRMEGDLFVSPNYSRPFHSARCIVK
jgi:hypothetical protein